jgi:hypothetical protein
MPMGDLAAPQAFGTGSPGELAQQPSAASLLGQLFGSIQPAPEAPPQVVYPTKNPLTAITDQDINRGIDIGLGFSGGGLGIKAYHGSPHSFERFDPSKIGTGEGAQAYGHGLYFAENPQVAEEYKRAITQAQLEKFHDDLLKYGTAQKPAQSKGHMYEVDINAAPEHLLDWDATLGSQPKAVREAFAKQLEQFGPDAKMQAQMMIAASRHPHGLRGVTQDLAAQGVPGIKYLDQGSRGAGEGSRNYVVFDPNLIDITRKYGLLGAPAVGGMGALAAQNYTLPQEGM